MALNENWAGRIFGTSTGNVFVKLTGSEDGLTGSLHLNEPGIGIAVYSIAGKFDGERLSITGQSETKIAGVYFAPLKAKAFLNSRGELQGEWETESGGAGTFQLFPHSNSGSDTKGSSRTLDQLHTVRYQFRAISIDRPELILLADEIQSSFEQAQVVVTVTTGTEQARYLSDFDFERASMIKLFIREAETSGLDRIVQIEFGPQINFSMVQGSDESWVLGFMEKLKRGIKPYERTYATNFKKMNFGINQLLLAGAVVTLPSLPSLNTRALLMLAVLSIVFCVNWLHQKYLPFAVIYLDKRPASIFAKVTPSFVSWVIAVTASLVSAWLAFYLIGKPA